MNGISTYVSAVNTSVLLWQEASHRTYSIYFLCTKHAGIFCAQFLVNQAQNIKGFTL